MHVGRVSEPSTVSRWSPEELIPFGKYLLLDRISVGATAALYRAKVQGEAGFEKIVAVKRILPQMAGDPEFVETFVREAKIAAQLSHTNICPIYELGKVGESLYMSMEHIAGKDLGRINTRLIEQGKPMDPVMAAWVASKLCEALDYAHSLKDPLGRGAGLVHRDLSPSNILVSYEGQVKLIDFGLAKASGRATQTNVDALKQKLGYMSPEMVKGRPVDHRSDIFGVGVCLYEMVTQRRLFHGKDEISTLKMLGTASFPPPSAVCEDPPEELELIIMRALEREPEDRWDDAAEMNEALQAFIAEQLPTYGSRQLSRWIQEEFAIEMQSERKRLRTLLEASNQPGVLEERKRYFHSRAGAAAASKSARQARLEQRETQQRASIPPQGAPSDAPSLRPAPSKPPMPTPPPVRREDAEKLGASVDLDNIDKLEMTPVGAMALDPSAFQGDRDGDFGDEPTAFYDKENADPAHDPAFGDEPTAFYAKENADPAHDPAFGDEPTSFYEGKPGSEEVFVDEATSYYPRGDADPGGFEDDATHFYGRDGQAQAAPAPDAANAYRRAVDPPPAPEHSDVHVELDVDTAQEAGTFEEEATQIYFSTEEGIGLEDLPNALYGSLRPPPARPPGQASTSGAESAVMVSPPLAPRAPLSATTTQRLAPATAPSDSRRRRNTLYWTLVGLLCLVAGVGAYFLLLRPPPKGSMEIRANPEIQAVVLLDGVHRGRTPLRIDRVKPGLHRLEVRASGYESVVRAVPVRKDTTAQVRIDLEREPSSYDPAE